MNEAEAAGYLNRKHGLLWQVWMFSTGNQEWFLRAALFVGFITEIVDENVMTVTMGGGDTVRHEALKSVAGPVIHADDLDELAAAVLAHSAGK